MTSPSEDAEIQKSDLETVKLVFLVIGILLVVSAQLLLSGAYQGDLWGPYAILGFGILAFILAVRSFLSQKFSPIILNLIWRMASYFGLKPYQLPLLLGAPLFSLIAWLAAGDGAHMFQPLLAICAWLMGIVLFLVGHLRKADQDFSSEWEQRDSLIFLLLLAISLLARGFLLEDIPWLLTGDEASAGLSAVEFIQGERNNVFTTGWYSFPSLFFWTQSLSIRVLGQTTLGLRLPSMLAGALTVPALYWFTKPFFGRTLALFSSAFLAVFHFHVHFSRIGLNNIWDGLFIVLFMGIIWRAWTEVDRPTPGTSSKFALAGILLGISQYFYTSVRILAALFVLFVILRYLQDREGVRRKIPGLISTSLGFVVSFLPLGAYFIGHPEQFTAPFARVSHLGPWLAQEKALTGQSAVQILTNQFRLATLGFTHENLRNWYTPDKPMLLAIPAALFIMGIIILVFKFRQPLVQWIFLWLIGAISISALSESTPAAQRLTFAAPAVALIAALPLSSLEEWLVPIFPQRKKLVYFAIGTILSIAMVGDLAFYFGNYSQSRTFGDTNTEVAQGVADYLNTIDGSPTVYFFGLPRMGYFTHSSIPYLAPDASGVDIPEQMNEPPAVIGKGALVFVFLPERRGEIELIRSTYPDGEEMDFISRNNDLLFTVYLVEDNQR